MHGQHKTHNKPPCARTLSALNAGWRTGAPPCGGTSREPCDPSFTSTVSTPRCCSADAAARMWASVSVGRPVRRLSSVSLGLSTVTRPNSSSHIGSSLPPASKMTGTPAARAARAAARLTDSGTSRWRRSIPEAATWRRASSPGALHAVLAPPTMMMLFSPSGCSTIMACPVGESTLVQWVRSTPH